MLAAVSALLLAISWFEQGSKASGVPVFFDWQGTAVLGLVALALYFVPWRDWRHRS